MKAHKAYYDMLDFVPNAQQGIPKLFPCVQEEVKRLKVRIHEHENLLRECEALKAQVRMLVKRVSELERVL
ncbi:hypothetical protein F2Q70_00005239 [Brassica cretica]|uniref:Uncharacterized protein n=1 Tax=Brassica cretica TaxID=69181 RepID=A0A8S9IXC6_BRACR|nr:hypothetical protein F2Q70_00005239 [Brassica cretica]KAF3562010.1 hypothetical protein DY000_02017444 [Brassica cretica]